MRNRTLFFSLCSIVFGSAWVLSLPKNQSHPNYVKTIKPIFEKKCFNCHSQYTEYPFYYNLPFAKKIIDRDIEKAIEHLDMSQDFPFKGIGQTKFHLKEIEKVVKNKTMPPLRYKFLHWGANLSKKERKQILQWIEFLSSQNQLDTKDLPNEEPVKPIPMTHNQDPEIVALGDELFHEPRLSMSNAISCARCHSLSEGGDDGRRFSIGTNGTLGKINSPTVFNSGFNFRQFWDGRSPTLEDQIDGPLINPTEMGLSWEQAVKKISSIPKYKKAFEKNYPDGVTKKNIKNAIATFERSLITPNSAFDNYLRGDKEAITVEEKEGYELFKSYGCMSCHQGVLLGGNLYEKFGLFGDYFKDRGNITKEDYGRFNVTGHERDKFKFKVPGLRNVSVTAPYFHDGTVDDLEEAVRLMAKYQLGRKIPKTEAQRIAQFLETLTGEYQGKKLRD